METFLRKQRCEVIEMAETEVKGKYEVWLSPEEDEVQLEPGKEFMVYHLEENPEDKPAFNVGDIVIAELTVGYIDGNGAENARGPWYDEESVEEEQTLMPYYTHHRFHYRLCDMEVRQDSVTAHDCQLMMAFEMLDQHVSIPELKDEMFGGIEDMLLMNDLCGARSRSFRLALGTQPFHLQVGVTFVLDFYVKDGRIQYPVIVKRKRGA